MCRFVIYSGPPIPLDHIITRPAHSIIQQSKDSTLRSEPVNGDGFGMAWYVPSVSPHPGVFRSIRPAWNNRNVRSISRVTTSGLVAAHVRAASPELPVADVNCHPFTFGRYAFMHNGGIARFKSLRRRLVDSLSDAAYEGVEGTTDSEIAFALFLDRLDVQPSDLPASDRIANAVEKTIHDIVQIAGGDDVSYLNFAVTDGKRVVASRFATDPKVAPSLFLNEGCHYVLEGDQVHLRQCANAHSAVVISSEPLSADEEWKEIERNSLVVVTAKRRVLHRKLAC